MVASWFQGDGCWEWEVVAVDGRTVLAGREDTQGEAAAAALRTYWSAVDRGAPSVDLAGPEAAAVSLAGRRSA